MKFFSQILLLLSWSTLSTAYAAGSLNTDPKGDVHFSPMACSELQTDLVGTEFKRIGDQFVVTMISSKNIQRNFGYKEFYFWLDITHDKKQGYQPYNPASVAWPNLFANYRIFYSVDANDFRDSGPSERVALQDCFKNDCSEDVGLNHTSKIKVNVNKNVVTFRFPVNLLPEISKTETVRVGYTTYFEFMQCSGEDDSPQWGEDAFEIPLLAPPLVPQPH